MKKFVVFGVLILCGSHSYVHGQDLYVGSDNPGPSIDGLIGKYNATTGAVVNASLVSGLSYPDVLAVSGSDLFVTSSNGNLGSIGEYTTSGGTVNALLIPNLNTPFGIAISGSNLFVANYGSNTIGEYTTSGTVMNASLVSGLVGPFAIAISGSNLFVVNGGNTDGTNTIGEYNATTGAIVNASLVTGLYSPLGLVLSGSDMFVSDWYSGTIGEYTTSGAVVNASLVSGLSRPAGIAVSGSDLFVANEGSNTIGEYTTSGAVVNASLVSGLSSPEGIAVVDAPEPSTLALLAAGAIGLAGYVWRRRAARRPAKLAAVDQQDARAILSFPSHSSSASAARRAA